MQSHRPGTVNCESEIFYDPELDCKNTQFVTACNCKVHLKSGRIFYVQAHTVIHPHFVNGEFDHFFYSTVEDNMTIYRHSTGECDCA